MIAIIRPLAPIVFSCGTLLTLLCAALLTPHARAQNLLTNPSFESGSFVDGGDGFMTLPSGSTAITAWTTYNDELNWYTTPNVSSIPASDGLRFLDLYASNQADDPGPFGGVQQTIATTPGQRYDLALDLGSRKGNSEVSWSAKVSVTAGSSTTDFTFNPVSASPQWGHFAFAFTATSSSTPISIRGASVPLGAYTTYIGLDNVSLSTSVVAAQQQAGTSTAIPGGSGNFTSFAAPSLSAGRTAFYGTGSSGQQGIYATYPPGPYKVADTATAIPGGTGNFERFQPPGPIGQVPPSPIISGENVAFYGEGSGGQAGIYVAQPPSPGVPPQPIKFADTNTAIPGGTGNFERFYPPSPIYPPSPGISGANVAFYGAGSGGQQGIYVIFPPSPLTPPSPFTVADTSTAIPGGTGNFVTVNPNPGISAQNVAFMGTGSGGQQGVYIAVPPTPFEPPSPFLVADTNTAIPGGTGNFTGFFPPTPFQPPGPGINGQDVAFIGTGSGGQMGVYVSLPPEPIVPPGPYLPPTPLRIADLNTVIPGGLGTFTSFDAVGLSDTDVAFLGLGSDGQKGIFDYTHGSLLSVVNVGSTLDGKIITDLAFARRGLFEDPIAFQAFFNDGSQGIYTMDVVPEPASAMLLTIAALFFTTTTQRTRRKKTQVGTNY